MHIPQDLLKIIMQYKKDMELFEYSSNCFTEQELMLPNDPLNFPIQIMYDYHAARHIYRQRLAVWGLYEVVIPERPFLMLL